MNILIISHTPRISVFKIGSHHIYDELKKSRHHIYYLSTPTHIFSKNFWRNFKNQSRGLIPWKVIQYIPVPKKIKLMIMSIVILPKNFRNQKFEACIVDDPRLYPITRNLNIKKIIYRPSDIYQHAFKSKMINYLERKIVTESSHIIVTSTPLKKHIKSKYNMEATLITNGVSIEGIKASGEKTLPEENKIHNICTYVGAFDVRLDPEIIIFCAERLKNIKFVLIGPMKRELISTFRKYKNIEIKGELQHKEAMNILIKSDIGLLPLSKHLSNQARSPMKLYEYGYNYLPVISMETEELTHRNEPFVYLCKSKDEFCNNILKVLKDKDLPKIKKIARESSLKHTWEEKTKKILWIIENELH